MATITLNSLTHGRHRWNTLTDGDDGTKLVLPMGGGCVAVQATGTFGGDVALEGTIDDTNWFPLLTGPGGSAVTFSEAGYAEISTAVYAIRPLAGTGVSDVDVTVRVIK